MRHASSQGYSVRGLQELLLIRHATTDMTGLLCGHSDPPLNAAGIEQARGLAQLLSSGDVHRLFASDLQRAVQTAQPLAELWGIPIVVRSALREISFGHWEGRRWSQIHAEEPGITRLESSPELCAPGGETFACFRERVLQALRDTAADCDGHLAAIVTHLGVIRVVLNELSSSAHCVWEPQQRIDHCSVYQIRLKGGFVEHAVEIKGGCPD
jgi:broad specificity phosphatase PhoE